MVQKIVSGNFSRVGRKTAANNDCLRLQIGRGVDPWFDYSHYEKKEHSKPRRLVHSVPKKPSKEVHSSFFFLSSGRFPFSNRSDSSEIGYDVRYSQVLPRISSVIIPKANDVTNTYPCQDVSSADVSGHVSTVFEAPHARFKARSFSSYLPRRSFVPSFVSASVSRSTEFDPLDSMKALSTSSRLKSLTNFHSMISRTGNEFVSKSSFFQPGQYFSGDEARHVTVPLFHRKVGRQAKEAVKKNSVCASTDFNNFSFKIDESRIQNFFFCGESLKDFRKTEREENFFNLSKQKKTITSKLSIEDEHPFF